MQLTLPRLQSLRKVFAPSFPTADHSCKQSCSKPMNSITSAHQIRSFNPSNHAHDLFQTHNITTISTQTHRTKCRSRRISGRHLLLLATELSSLPFTTLSSWPYRGTIPAIVPNEQLFLAGPSVTSTLWCFQPIPTSRWTARYHSVFQSSIMQKLHGGALFQFISLW